MLGRYNVMYGLKLDEVTVAGELILSWLVYDTIKGDHEGSARM